MYNSFTKPVSSAVIRISRLVISFVKLITLCAALKSFASICVAPCFISSSLVFFTFIIVCNLNN